MSKIENIDVGKEFYHRLANRDEKQGDGTHNAVEFRKKFLADFDNAEAWKDSSKAIILNFKNVTKLGPSFANEAFAYFTQYANPEKILEKFRFTEISNVKLLIIKEELSAGYKKPGWRKLIGL